jgi:hypothetical protein
MNTAATAAVARTDDQDARRLRSSIEERLLDEIRELDARIERDQEREPPPHCKRDFRCPQRHRGWSWVRNR